MSDYISKKTAMQIVLNEQNRRDMLDKFKSIPSADVRENIHGKWVPKERTTDCSVDIDIVCSECGYVGIERYAHGYELNELPVQEMKDYIKKFDMNYCTCCGAKMDKSESEDKK